MRIMRVAAVVAREGHEVAESVARGLLEQALDALDEDDLRPCAARMARRVGGIGRHLGGMQRGVEVRLREFLNPEAKGEMVWREDRDGVLADRGLAAAGRPRDEHDLSVVERLEDSGRARRAADGKLLPNVARMVAQRHARVVLERAEDLRSLVPIGVPSRAAAGRSSRRRVRACKHRGARLGDKGVPRGSSRGDGIAFRAVCASRLFKCASVCRWP